MAYICVDLLILSSFFFFCVCVRTFQCIVVELTRRISVLYSGYLCGLVQPIGDLRLVGFGMELGIFVTKMGNKVNIRILFYISTYVKRYIFSAISFYMKFAVINPSIPRLSSS